MRFALLPLAMLAAPTLAREPGPAAKLVCRAIGLHEAGTPDAVAIRPLGEQPPARQILALLHTEGGCQTPIVVHDSVGVVPQMSATSRP